MLIPTLALLVVSATAPTGKESLPDEVSESLRRALVVPGARIVPLSWSRAQHCRVRSASVPRPVDGSGRVAVKFVGEGCSGWAWVRVEVWAETAVTTRLLRAGEAVASATTMVEREMRPGRMPFVPPAGAVAVHTLPAGTVLDAGDVGLSSVRVGESLKVLFVSGGVVIETLGRRTTCLRDRDCAVLPSGKHVEGRLDTGGRLVVEVPR